MTPTRFATSHGQRLAYTDSQGSGPAVVLLHGWSGNKGLTQKGTQPLLDAGFRVVCLDYLGHGESDYPADEALYTRQMAADHIVAVLDAAAIVRAHVIGYSMGGHHAAHVASLHPDRVLSVIIGGTALSPDDGQWVAPDAPWSARSYAFARAQLFDRTLVGAHALAHRLGWMLSGGWMEGAATYPTVGVRSFRWAFGGLRAGVLAAHGESGAAWIDAREPALRASWLAMVPSWAVEPWGVGDGSESGLDALHTLGRPVMLWCGAQDEHHGRMAALAAKHGWAWLEVQGGHLSVFAVPASVAAVNEAVVRFLEAAEAAPASAAS